MSTKTFLVSRTRNGKQIFWVVFLFITFGLIDYVCIKEDSTIDSQEFWAVHTNVSREATRNVRRSRSLNEMSSGNSSHASRARILCWVMTGPQNHYSKAIHVKQTWGARCDKLIFISSKTDVNLGAISIPGVKEGRDWLWAKTKGALKYIWEQHRDEYDWFLKADDDTYIIMENLRHFLKNYDASQPYYFGRIYNWKVKVNLGGPGYILSRETLRIFVEQALPDAKKCDQGHIGGEDIELGNCLAHVGIKPTDTRDYEGKNRFLHERPQDHFGFSKNKTPRSFWGPEAPGLNCCSPGLIFLHHIDPETLYIMEFLIYHLHLYGSEAPNQQESSPVGYAAVGS